MIHIWQSFFQEYQGMEQG